MLLHVNAILVAPVLLAILFVVTTPENAIISPALLWSGYYLIAHLFFWPPFLLTRYLARRLEFTSPLQLAAAMAVCSVVMTLALGIIPALNLKVTYTWRAGLRDALVEALAAVACLWLYVAIRGLNRRPPVGAAPNKRWSGRGS